MRVNENGSSTTSPAPVRLKRGRIHAIGLVDEAANGWNWLAIQKSKLRKNGGNMDAASGAAGAAANGASAGATTKALQLPPNTKNVVMALLTSAMEGLSTIQTALQDAEEADGATMPAELLGAIEQSGMELVAFAQQHGANSDAGGEAVSMSAGEVEIANALVDSAPEIVKSFMSTITKSRGNTVAKGAIKVAPAHVVSLIKELLDDFVGRASKWGGMFGGDAPAAAAPAADGATVANGKKDPAAALKSVRDASAARVNKSTSGATDVAGMSDDEIVKALKALPDLQAQLVALQKSVVGGGGGNIDPVDDFAALMEGDNASGDALEFMPGDNMSASIRKSLSKGKKRVDDEDDEDV